MGRHSLRTKLTAITVAAVLATLVTSAVLAALTVGRAVNTSSAEKMHLLCENSQRLLDSYLNDICQSVDMTSHIATNSLDGLFLIEHGADKEPGQRTRGEQRSLDVYLGDYVSQLQEEYGYVASHTDGVVAYYYCVNPNISEAQRGFFFTRLGKVGFEERDPIDVAVLDPNDEERDAWYFSTIYRGAPSWLGPYKARLLDEVPTVSYVMPVYKSGMLVGIMGMDILFDTLVDQIESLKVYETGYACLLDDQGRVVHHPEFGEDGAAVDKAQTFGDAPMERESSGNADLYYDKGSEQWQMSYTTLSNGMKLVVTAPVSEVRALWLGLLGTVPIVGVIILTLFVPIALFATGEVTTPLRQLTGAAHRLSSGDYDIELDYQGKDEVGELTDAFRHLREHLQAYTSNLNSESFSDDLTGVKNRQAYDMYAAQVNDTLGGAGDQSDTRFAIAVFECQDLKRISKDFGPKYVDESVRSVSKLLCKVYSRAAVFRMDQSMFVAFLQGRNYANREELLCDFDILADEINATATEPWLQVHATKGMATYHPQQDKGVGAVMERAVSRMESS